MKVFAHRGASGHYPENTLAAFQAALESGCTGIELDIFLHHDELVVIHDRQLARTTNGSGWLEDHSRAALQQLDAGNGEPVPTLWQVLCLCANRLEINIEVKDPAAGSALLAILRRAQQELGLSLNQVLVSSFHHPLLWQLQQQWPALPLGLLIAHYPLDLKSLISGINLVSLHCDRGFVDAALVQQAHQQGLAVYVYTVNEEREALQLAAAGVDGIFCNYPAQALHWFSHPALA